MARLSVKDLLSAPLDASAKEPPKAPGNNGKRGTTKKAGIPPPRASKSSPNKKRASGKAGEKDASSSKRRKVGESSAKGKEVAGPEEDKDAAGKTSETKVKKAYVLNNMEQSLAVYDGFKLKGQVMADLTAKGPDPVLALRVQSARLVALTEYIDGVLDDFSAQGDEFTKAKKKYEADLSSLRKQVEDCSVKRAMELSSFEARSKKFEEEKVMSQRKLERAMAELAELRSRPSEKEIIRRHIESEAFIEAQNADAIKMRDELKAVFLETVRREYPGADPRQFMLKVAEVAQSMDSSEKRDDAIDTGRKTKTKTKTKAARTSSDPKVAPAEPTVPVVALPAAPPPDASISAASTSGVPHLEIAPTDPLDELSDLLNGRAFQDPLSRGDGNT